MTKGTSVAPKKMLFQDIIDFGSTKCVVTTYRFEGNLHFGEAQYSLSIVGGPRNGLVNYTSDAVLAVKIHNELVRELRGKANGV